MPRVPEDQPAKFSTQVPGVNFPMHNEFGKVGAAAENLGGDVENAAMTANNIYTEVQRQEAISQADSASVQHKLWSDQYTRDLKISSPDGLIHENGDQQQPAVQNQDGTPRTITQEFWDQSNSRYQADQDNMSPMAAAMYRQKMLPEIGARATVLNNDAYAMRLQAADTARDQTNQSVFGEFDKAPYDQTYGTTAYPDLNKFSDYAQQATLDLQRQGGVLDPATGQFKGGLRNQTEINMLKTKQLNDYGKNWMESSMTKLMEESAHNGPHTAQDVSNLLDVVKGQDPQSLEFAKAGKITPSGALSPQERLIYEDRLLKMIPAAQSMDMSEFNLYKTNYEAAASQGKYPLGQQNASRNNLMNWMDTFEKTGQWSTADRIKSMGDITASEAKGMLAGRTFDLQPVNQQHALTERASESALMQLKQEAQMRGMAWSEDIGNNVANEVRAKGVENVNKIEAQKQGDFAGFLSGQDSFGMGKYRNGTAQQVSKLDWTNPQGLEKSGMMKSYEQTLGKNYAANYGKDMEYWRPLSKDQSSTLGASLQSMSPTQAAQSIQSLKRSFGPAFGNVMDTMINDKSLTQDWKVYGSVPTTQGLVAQIAANQGLQQTKELYEARTGEKFDELRAKVGQTYSPDISALLGAAPLNTDQKAYAASILNTATNAAAQQRLLNPGQSLDQSVQNARDEAFKNYPRTDVVGNHAKLFGWNTPFSSGPQVTTEFPNNLSDQQRAIVKQNLSSAMTEEGMKGLGVVAPKPAPGQPDFGDKFHAMASKNLAHISLVQGPNGPGYTFDYTGVNADGKSNGVMNHLMRSDMKGNVSPVFLPLSDLLVPRNVTAAPARTQTPLYKPPGFQDK